MFNIDLILSTFTPLDYLILIISIFLIFFSLLRGFIQSLLGLITWVGSILITIHFHINLSNLISAQLSKYEKISQLIPINEISKYVLSIPIIFFASLFLLKKFKKYISSDLNKNFIGTILDKIFGALFGFVFIYILITTILVSPSIFKYKWLEVDIVNSLKNNSELIKIVDNLNSEIIPYEKEILEKID